MALLSCGSKSERTGFIMEGKPKVLMIGPGRKVRGGITTVVDHYYEYGLDREVDLCYLSTMEDGSKVKKLLIAMKSFLIFCGIVNRYDVIHVHMAAQASFDRKAFFVKKAYKLGKKIIIHQHAADFDQYFFHECNEIKRNKIKKIFGMADKVIALSEEWAKFFGENVCKPSKIMILHNGVSIPEDVKTDYSDQNVLVLGRLGERKGTYDLLNAIPRVLEKVPDAVFFLGGDGEVEQCKKIVVDGKLEEHVKILGWLSKEEKEEYFRSCSTFILPSRHEGMPMAVLEAMSHGLATISTNVGGIGQIIEQGISGIMMEPGNVNEVSKCLISLLRDEKLREDLGTKGRERIRKSFDFKNNLTRLVQTYYELVK